MGVPVMTAEQRGGDSRSEDQALVRVLVVEDDEITLALLTRLVNYCGATASEAASLREAREVLEREEFDVLITDYRLRDGTGIEVATVAQGRVPHVVLISGSSAGVPMGEASAAGVDSFVPKYELTGSRVCDLLARLVGEDRGLRDD